MLKQQKSRAQDEILLKQEQQERLVLMSLILRKKLVCVDDPCIVLSVVSY